MWLGKSILFLMSTVKFSALPKSAGLKERNEKRGSVTTGTKGVSGPMGQRLWFLAWVNMLDEEKCNPVGKAFQNSPASPGRISPFLRPLWKEFPGGPVVRTLHFHCRGHRFDPWSGN